MRAILLKNRKICVFIYVFFIMLSTVRGGITGKIAGKVVDAETGEPLPGANILVEDLSLGAAADFEGDYFILNVPPGVYLLKATYIGFSTVIKENVEVTVDHTTRVDFKMTPVVLKGEEVVVTAVREEVVHPDISNSREVLSDDQLNIVPVLDFRDLISKQTSIDFRLATRDLGGSYGAGYQDQVYTFQQGIRIRGGSISETAVLQDGINLQDGLTNAGFIDFNLSTIQSLEIISGGFNAEYGNIRSGLVNVVTKEGGPLYHGSIHLKGRKPGLKYYGFPLYDPSYNLEWKVFGVPEALTSHPEVPPENDLRPDFKGWEDWAQKHDPLNYQEIGKPDPRRPNNLLTPEQWQELWKFRSRMRKGVMNPQDYWDQHLELSLGGPLFPGWDRITFFSTYKSQKIWYPIPNSLPFGINKNATLKLSSRLTPNLKVILSGMFNYREGVALYKNPDIAALDPVSASWANRYNVDANMAAWFFSRSISEQYTGTFGISINHVINSNIFYDLKIGYYEKRWDNHKPDNYRRLLFDENGNVVNKNVAYKIDVTGQVNPQYYDEYIQAWQDNPDLYPPPNLIKEGDSYYYVYDEAPGGFFDVNTEDPFNLKEDEFGRSISGRGDQQVFDSYNKKFNAKLDLSNQINKFNLLKMGFEYDFLEMEYWESQWKPGRNRRWFFTAHPYHFALYLQDKIEFEGMILNAGLRMDMANARTIVYTDPFSVFLRADKITEVMDWNYPDDMGKPEDLANPFPEAPHRKSKTRLAISPRLGVSHPFTSTTKFFFNFGYFYQEPESHYLYKYYVRDANDLYLMPNPDLDYELTIAYELGFDQSLFDVYRLHIAGYYRDQSNLVKTYKYENLDGSISYRTHNNNGYGQTSGLEVRLEKRMGQFLVGTVSYDYYSSSYGETGINIYKQGQEEGEIRPVERVGSVRWLEKPTPSFRANIDFHTPDFWGFKIINFYPLGGWRVNILHEWNAGRWFTYNENEQFGPDEFVESNMQWRDHMNTNLKVEKNFAVLGVNLRAYMEVHNLFDRKELFADESLWDVNDTFVNYMESLRLPQREDVLDDEGKVIIKRHGNDKPGDFPIVDKNGNIVDKEWIVLPNFPQIMFLFPREYYFGIEIYF